MQIKAILTILVALILTSCYSGKDRDFLYGSGGSDALDDVLNSEYIQLDFFLDVGLVRIKSIHLYVLNGAPRESVVDAVLSDNLCGRGGFARDSSWLGSKIDSDGENSEYLNSTCMLYIDHFYLEKNMSLESVMNNFFRKRTFEINRTESWYNISYTGSKLNVTGTALKEYDVSEDEHKLSFSSAEPHHTIIIKKAEKDLSGYKPLKLDPSILPLESPGYRRLREQEEALSR